MDSKQRALIVVGVMATAGIGYFSGYHHAERNEHKSIEAMANEQLGYHLAMLGWIDSNKKEDVKRLLQASTNRQLDWIIEYGHLNTEPDYVQSRCKLIRKLKTYRKQHKLFETPEWDHLWKMPGNRAAEDRRIAFLESACMTESAKR